MIRAVHPARRHKARSGLRARIALGVLALVLLVTGLPQVKLHHHAPQLPHPAPGMLVLLDHVQDHGSGHETEHGGTHSGLHVHETTSSAYFPTASRTDGLTHLVAPRWLLPMDARPAGTVDPLPLQRPPIA